MSNIDPKKHETGFADRLDQLEQTLITSSDPINSIINERLYTDLDLLLRVSMIKYLKLGSERIASERLNPAQLILIAQQAAIAGLIGIDVPLIMRSSVETLKHRLIQNQMWDHKYPLWWEPLPPATGYEKIWVDFERNFDGVLEKIGLSGKTQENLEPGWFAKPDFIEIEIIDKVNDELIKTQQKDKFLFEEEGTGELATVSSDRTDAVLYFNGQEKTLIENAPYTAILIQWVLKTMGPWLRKTFSLNTFVTPHKAMLSRYHANSTGYSRHLDNPGEQNDNGRYLTLLVYLNSRNFPIKGGDLAIWNKGDNFSERPDQIIEPGGGTAVLFKSREIPHQVLPLQDGPDRWALVIWFNDRMEDSPDMFLSEISLTDVLLPLMKLSLPDHTLLFHKLNEDFSTGKLVSARYDSGKMRVGIISTVYMSSGLEEWCSYHYSIGVDHICLVFDHLEEEQELQLSERLLKQFGKPKITVWDGNKMSYKWDQLKADNETTSLIELASYRGSTYAISARQTLNASVALQIAKTDSFGGQPLDWLIHLDDDEYFHLEGKARGGDCVYNHFAAATNAGVQIIRYINHELLIEDSDSDELRYKLNPLMAECIVGPVGWMKISEYLGFDSEHSYFNAYTNGKSAVYVPSGVRSAGMHSWVSTGGENPNTNIYLAGPSILHRRFYDFQSFKRKYIEIASSPALEDKSLFPISSLEKEAVQIIRSLKESGSDQKKVDNKLFKLYNSIKHSKKIIQILEKAGLIISPKTLPTP